ncbi:alpha/beta hydrolase [Marinoscillum pacificum]|uniref:alpha/beta hydrolase n=1 Tax=Marinoscillum pacificum TaxID=392723 RepID=UPI00215701BC|nr:alpha/beta hydrolase [Marinoscillum pacificum]
MSSADETQYFLSQDGLRIYYRHWEVESPHKICCIVHGHGEHSNRYEHIAKALNSAGITVFVMDLRGHGLSYGKKGHAKSYDLLMSDIEELLKTARAEYTDLPMYLMGHSMGGNLVANYVIRMNTNELSGFILSSPWFKLAFDPPAWKIKLGKFFSKVYPAITQPSGLDVNSISRDPEEVQAYINDPMVHDQVSAGLHAMITEAGDYALNNTEKVKLKGLIYHGTGDQIIDWKATEQFAEQIAGSSFTALEGVYHEPHNDLTKDQVIEMVKQFILEN